MIRSDKTTMGGTESKPLNTHWSVILGALSDDQTLRRISMENLAKVYWKPIYCYIRKKGFENEEAKDLTQDFFYKFFLNGKLLQAADVNRGCFRHLLSAALNHHLINVKRDRNRQIRVPKGGFVALSSADLSYIDIPASEATPEQAFNYAWVTNLLDQVLTETKQQCHEAGQKVHWQVFYRMVLAPILEDAKVISMKEISQIFCLKDANQVNSRIVTVKRRFARILKGRLRNMGGSDSQAKLEFDEIMRFLSEKSARL